MPRKRKNQMARSRSIGNVYAELSVKDKMTYGLGKVTKSLKSFGVTALKTGSVAGGALAAGMLAGTKRAIDLGGSLTDLSTATGVAIADAMKLQAAYKAGGLDADGFGKDIAKMQKNIFGAGGDKDNPFAALGLSAEKLINLNPADQFNQIGKALMAIENPAKRNALAIDIFGKSGSKLTTVFGQMDKAAIALGRMPEVAQKFAAAFDEAGDIIDALPNKSDQFFIGFTSGIIGQILPGLDSVNKTDFTTLGENLGNAISRGIEAITNGSIWEIFKLNAEKALNGIEIAFTQNQTIGETINTWAAGLNALLDFGASPENGGSQNFMESFNKYAQAGISVMNDRTAEIDSRIKQILEQNKSASEAKKAGAAAMQSPPVDVPSLDPITLKETSKVDLPDFQATQYEVNEMQRRGLGMGGEYVAKEAKTQVSILEQIRDVLRNAKIQDKQLVWDT